MLTVEPASAVPLTSGLLSLAGESGSVSVRLGVAGAAVSTVKERVAAEPSVLPTESVARTWNV